MFGAWLADTVPDSDHSVMEVRFITVGMSRLLNVSHTDRGNKIRIISARPLTRKETKLYETTRQKYH